MIDLPDSWDWKATIGAAPTTLYPIHVHAMYNKISIYTSVQMYKACIPKVACKNPIRTPAHFFYLFLLLHSAQKDTNSSAVFSPSLILWTCDRHQGEFCFSFTADVHGNGYMWIEQNPMRCQRETDKEHPKGPFPSSFFSPVKPNWKQHGRVGICT